MLTVRLPEELDRRLADLAKATKRPKSFYVREALERALEDLEDAYLAEAAYEEHLASGEPGVPIEEVMRARGLSPDRDAAAE